MAQVGTANTQSGPELAQLIEFIDELRRSGFSIGTQQYFAVHDLLIALAAHGRLPKAPEGLKTWLAPILCASPKEQESFYREFDHWLEGRRDPRIRRGFVRSHERPRKQTSILTNLLSWRVALGIVICLLITAGAIVFFKTRQRRIEVVAPVATPSPSPTITVAAQSPASTPAPTPIVARKRWGGPYLIYFDQIRVAAVGLPFLIVGIWWFQRSYRYRSQLEKWSTTRKPRLEKITVGGVTAHLFRNSGFRRIAQELRRHRRSESYDLDVSPTVGATIRAGGWFTPIYSSRRVSPEYLVLIDRLSFRDQQAQLEDKLISRLVEDNVFVDRYYFHRDPRICRKEDPSAPHLTLRDLAALHPDHYLIVFSDGAGLINQLTGRPQGWLEYFSAWPGRALLTESSLPDWGYSEWALSGLGFVVLPASEPGLQLLVEAINTRTSQRTIAGDWSQRYPRLLQERPERWLEPSAPEPAVVDELCEQLRAFLGAEGYVWLGACSVYPVLQWDLTLYFGLKLTALEGFEERLLSLVRLPWFRHGLMPDWFRERLISDLSADRERAIRQVLEELLITSLEQPSQGFALDVARQGSREATAWRSALRFIGRTARTRRLKSLLRDWIETEPEHSPLRDYVFLRFVSSRKQNKLAVSVPGLLRRVFLQQRATLGLSPIRGLLLAAVVSLVGWMAISWTRPIPQATGPNPTPEPVSQPGLAVVGIAAMYMAKDDGKGHAGAIVTSFDPNDSTQHCVVTLSTPQAGTRIRFSWNTAKGGGAKFIVAENADYITAGSEDKIEATLSLPPDWRSGKYEVAAAINDNVIRTVEYTFKEAVLVANATPSPSVTKTVPDKLPEFEIFPRMYPAIPANNRSQATFQVAFLEPPPAGTTIRISVPPPVTVRYKGQDSGAVAVIKLAEGNAVSDEIAIMSSKAGRFEVRALVLPSGLAEIAVVNFTTPTPSRIIFGNQGQPSSSSSSVFLTVQLADDGGIPLEPDQDEFIVIKSASADEQDLVQFEPKTVVLRRGSPVAQVVVHPKGALPEDGLSLLAVSPDGKFRPAQTRILVRSPIEKLMLTGPTEVRGGTRAEFIILLTDKEGQSQVADWSRRIKLSVTSGSLSPTEVTINKGESSARVQYIPSGQLGKVVLNAESAGLANGSLEIVVITATYWLVLAALFGGLIGGIARQLAKGYGAGRILPVWTGKKWDTGIVSMALGGIVTGLTFYWTIKLLIQASSPSLSAALNLDRPAAALFLGGIAGFAGLVMLDRLLMFLLEKKVTRGNTS